ncbi:MULTISPECIES: site-2 protease family protein [unclassified Pusillimonas]|uniref:site-2 protease family protein n=1 Tax=unclassified Pusillimonas TaxID=2640016 RepID=UPI000B9CC02C|nr:MULTISPECIES: site-2 protease family protein [unclassified Pusillimonas]OXR49119.1 site-2 protease family protein [Pusillimonas sp. T2]ROT45999.1 site-2 protease family protein [Pusillimonas sp. NJUB218]
MESIIQTITVYALPVLFGITLHEAAHGYVARMFGDPTAYQLGRVSLNPIRHIDPIGTIAVPLFLLLTTKLMGGAGLLFGWAKPVPVDWGRLRHPKRDMMWVALAGPGSNIVMAIIWALSLRLFMSTGMAPDDFWVRMAIAGIQVNLVLMALNLLPLPPLDGGRVVFSLLPDRLAYQYAKIEPYGMVILIVLMLTGALWVLLQPLLMLGQGIVRWFL